MEALHVTLAQTQTHGEPLQRVAGGVVNRPFGDVRRTCRALTARARLKTVYQGGQLTVIGIPT
jgi:hypothetical protein